MIELKPINRDKERQKLMQLSLEETKEEIVKIEITIQKLNGLKDKNINRTSVINQEIDKPIKELKTQKEYLEELYESDKLTSFKLMTSEQRHQAIRDKVCHVCKSKLSCYTYSEDSYAIECNNCQMLYAEE